MKNVERLLCSRLPKSGAESSAWGTFNHLQLLGQVRPACTQFLVLVLVEHLRKACILEQCGDRFDGSTSFFAQPAQTGTSCIVLGDVLGILYVIQSVVNRTVVARKKQRVERHVLSEPERTGGDVESLTDAA